MGTNPYFNNFNNKIEQNLYEDIVAEAIQIYGYDLYYLPRTYTNIDEVFKEEETSHFKKAYSVEMYVTNLEGFGGDGEFLSKFNIEIRDKITFVLSKKRFQEILRTPLDNKRPEEGDLIYFPMTGAFYEIHYVEQEHPFYQLGRLNVFTLACEIFTYSNEVFETGVPEIDRVGKRYSTLVDANNHLANNASISSIDPLAENDSFATLDDDIIDFSETNPFSQA